MVDQIILNGKFVYLFMIAYDLGNLTTLLITI